MAKKTGFPSGRPAFGSPADYDRQIDYHLKHRREGWQKEVSRLMQARNYNAKLYGKPERAWPRAIDDRPIGLKSKTKKKAKTNALQLVNGRLVKV